KNKKDALNFDAEFTKEEPVLTPVPLDVVRTINQRLQPGACARPHTGRLSVLRDTSPCLSSHTTSFDSNTADFDDIMDIHSREDRIFGRVQRRSCLRPPKHHRLTATVTITAMVRVAAAARPLSYGYNANECLVSRMYYKARPPASGGATATGRPSVRLCGGERRSR
ncbi:Protein kinase C, partial [Eumeta japonica]